VPICGKVKVIKVWPTHTQVRVHVLYLCMSLSFESWTGQKSCTFVLSNVKYFSWPWLMLRPTDIIY
jgi:hypothetical protein